MKNHQDTGNCIVSQNQAEQAIRKRGGEQIDNKNIKKHKNDVFRLLAIISLQELGEIPPAITADVRAFIDKADFESIDFRYFGLGKRSKTEVSEMLRTIYKISH